MYVYKSAAESGVTNTAYRVISLVAQDHAVAEGGEAPVSACKPLCAILLRKPSVYPLSPVKANVGQLCQDHFCRVILIDGSRGWVFVTAFERPLKSV